MAHEQTRQVLWTKRAEELARVQEIDADIVALQATYRTLCEERSRCVDNARHLEIAAVTLDMKGVPT